MPKTSFVDGVTSVGAAFLNMIFNHVHDGLDQDGSCPKIDLGQHTNLDTGGAAIAAPGHAVAWAIYEIDGTGALLSVLAEHNVASVSTADPTNHVLILQDNVRPDLDGAAGNPRFGASLVSFSGRSSDVLPAPSGLYKAGDNSERCLVPFLNASAAPTAPGAGLVSVVLFANRS